MAQAHRRVKPIRPAVSHVLPPQPEYIHVPGERQRAFAAVPLPPGIGVICETWSSKSQPFPRKPESTP